MSVIDEAAGQARLQSTIGFTARYGRWCRDNPQWSSQGDLMAKVDKFLQTAIEKRPDLTIEDTFEMLSTFMEQRWPDVESMDYREAIASTRRRRETAQRIANPVDDSLDDAFEEELPENDHSDYFRMRAQHKGRLIDAEQALKPGKAQRMFNHVDPRTPNAHKPRSRGY